METQPQSHSSPLSNRFQTDFNETEVSKMTGKLASLLITPPRKRLTVDEDMKMSSPIPPCAIAKVSEFQPIQKEQENAQIPVQEQVEVIVSVKEEVAKEQEKQEEVTEKKERCRYCDEPHLVGQLRDHQDNCAMKFIDCEACGEKVELDIFDFHLETCAARVDNLEAMYHAAQEEFLASLGLPSNNIAGHGPEPMDIEELGEQGNNGNSENGEYPGEQEGQEEEHDDEGSDDGFDPDALTYEQLLILDNTIVKKGMSNEEMKKFPVKIYLKNFDGAMSCSVCISECETGEMVRELSCGHKFHKDCVDTWLEENITCPCCKKYFR